MIMDDESLIMGEGMFLT